jgi:hypothetical protein
MYAIAHVAVDIVIINTYMCIQCKYCDTIMLTFPKSPDEQLILKIVLPVAVCIVVVLFLVTGSGAAESKRHHQFQFDVQVFMFSCLAFAFAPTYTMCLSLNVILTTSGIYQSSCSSQSNKR